MSRLNFSFSLFASVNVWQVYDKRLGGCWWNGRSFDDCVELSWRCSGTPNQTSLCSPSLKRATAKTRLILGPTPFTMTGPFPIEKNIINIGEYINNKFSLFWIQIGFLQKFRKYSEKLGYIREGNSVK